MFFQSAFENPSYYFSWVGFAVFSICMHESAHARMAVRFGDDTPRNYVGLNPFKQMGWFSLILLLIAGVAWGRVPVNAEGCGSRQRNMLVYLAGPLSNLVMCAVFALLSQTALLWDYPNLGHYLYYGSYVNGALFMLNICPFPPLDGFGAIRSLLTSPAIATGLNQFSGIGLMVLWMTPVGSYLFKAGAWLADFFVSCWMAPFRLFS